MKFDEFYKGLMKEDVGGTSEEKAARLIVGGFEGQEAVDYVANFLSVPQFWGMTLKDVIVSQLQELKENSDEAGVAEIDAVLAELAAKYSIEPDEEGEESAEDLEGQEEVAPEEAEMTPSVPQV